MGEKVYCGGCGKEMESGQAAYCDDCEGEWKYCYSCGSKLPSDNADQCANCGTDVPSGCMPVMVASLVTSGVSLIWSVW